MITSLNKRKLSETKDCQSFMWDFHGRRKMIKNTRSNESSFRVYSLWGFPYINK